MTTHDGTNVPAPYALADWRRCINDLYARIRANPKPDAAHEDWLATRSLLFRYHPMSPLSDTERGQFEALASFPYDPSLRFSVGLEAVAGPALEFELGRDGIMLARPQARTKGLIGELGSELTLYWIEGYGGGLFLPFRDATSGEETYGGGRYLIDAIKGSDLGLDDAGKLILDFNFAYTPSCAWSDAYVCPLAPEENTLPTPIRAGERDQVSLRAA